MNKKSVLVFTLISVLFVTIGCSEKKEKVYSGAIEGTEIPVVTEMGGQIKQLSVDEGLPVKKGDILMVLDQSSLQQQIKEAEAALAMAKASLDDAKAGTRGQELSKADDLIKQNQAQIDGLQAAKTKAEKALQQNIDRLAQLKSQLEGANSTLNLQQSRLQNLTTLYENGAETKDHLDNQTDVVNQAQTAVESLKSQVASQEKQITMAQDDLTANHAQISAAQAVKQSSEAQLDLLKEGPTVNTLRQLESQEKIAEGKLEEARIALSKTTIQSAVDGTIIRKNVSLGEVVKPSYQVMTLLQEGKLELKVYVPEAELNKVSAGEDVDVSVDAYPNTVFKGKVKTISSKAEFTPKNVQTPDERTKMVFKVTIDLTEGWGKLLPGMPADARFVGGTTK